MDQLPYIDWDAAAAAGRKLVSPGPELAPAEIADLVASLRRAAADAPQHVARVSGLTEPAPSPVLVVDRPRWIAANRAIAESMLRAAGTADHPETAAERTRGRLLGAQSGAVFALVASRILGQFDPFGTPQRLLLVAPNIVAAERKLHVVPAHFRLWVCLHEQTHRFQFGHAPWLVEHLLGLLREFLAEEMASLSWRPGSRPRSIADVIASPTQRAVFDRITAVMSLMEGHADVMMDRVGTAVVPTLPTIRAAFEKRRDQPGWPALVQKLLGLDLKRAQYRDGARFCRTVIDRVGVGGLNRAFESPDLLPTLAEIHDPASWIARTQG